jgi:dTDP-glucose pyrophosphorylase
MDPDNYERIKDIFEERPCDLISTLNWMDDPCAGASVETEDGRIVKITEKPRQGTAVSNWNQAGLFVCTGAMFSAMRACGLSPRGEIEFTAGVQKLLDQGRNVRCMYLPRDGFWSDVGTPEILSALNADPDVQALLR